MARESQVRLRTRYSGTVPSSFGSAVPFSVTISGNPSPFTIMAVSYMPRA